MSNRFTYLWKKKEFSVMKSVFFWLFFIFFLPALAQQAPVNFTVGNESVTQYNYSVGGYNDSPYLPGTTFSLNFGKVSDSDNGFNRVINSFQVDGRTYVRGEQGNTPFTKVVLKRIDNAAATGNKATAFFEVNGASGDNPIYVTPAYVNDMEGLINSYVFNRGSDNVFANDNSITKNNVERIDMIFENGIKAPANAAMLNRSGVLIMERGGNDSFKFAVIKSLTGGADPQVAELGTLKTADRDDAWGGTGVSIQSMVFQRDSDSGDLQPNQFLDAQQVFGTFITLQDLGVNTGDMIYGISIFANDVTDGDLVGMSSGYPSNTDGSSSETGGLDFMAGGGFFMLDNNVGGRVFHDADPDASAINNHTGGQDGSEINGLTLYASLTDTDGNVLATVPVENGGYTFYDVEDGAYKIVLHTKVGGASVSDLPGSWYPTGEGANAIKDGDVNGIISLSVPATGGGNLIMNNFGINVDPVVAVIKADDDDFGTITSTVDYTTPGNVFANDSLNLAPADLSVVNFLVGGTEVTSAVALKDSATGTDVPGVRLNPDGTVTVDAGTVPGTYTLDYTICEKANAGNCDDATIIIRVQETTVIKADDDDFGTITAAVDYTTPGNVFANDSLNLAPADLSVVNFLVGGTEVTAAVALKDSVTGTDVPGVRLNPDGTVTVDAGTVPGTYTLDYTICEKANAGNCDDATIIIRVGVFDLVLQKTVKAGQPAVFKEGDEVTFVITVKNEGSVDATDVEVVDYVPDGLELVGTDWVVTGDKAKLVTPILSLPAGTETQVEITFKVISDAKPSIRNAAEISAAKGGTDHDSTFDEDRNNDDEDEDDFDTALITICKKGGNCLPVKTTRIK